jgi:hypothetical protein
MFWVGSTSLDFVWMLSLTGSFPDRYDEASVEPHVLIAHHV